MFASLAPSSAEEQAWPLPEAECVVAADVPPREAACLVSEQLPGGWSRVGLAPLRADGSAVPEDDWSRDDWSPAPAEPPVGDSFLDECSGELQASTRFPGDDSSPDDSALAGLLAAYSLLADSPADSSPADCSEPDSPRAQLDVRSSEFPHAIGSPEFRVQVPLPVAERWPEDVRWSRSRVFPEVLLLLPDAPQLPPDASRQLRASATAVPDALPSLVASAQMELEPGVVFA